MGGCVHGGATVTVWCLAALRRLSAILIVSCRCVPRRTPRAQARIDSSLATGSQSSQHALGSNWSQPIRRFSVGHSPRVQVGHSAGVLRQAACLMTRSAALPFFERRR
jgi:hypothetical protein